jgi:hypothetical protein
MKKINNIYYVVAAVVIIGAALLVSIATVKNSGQNQQENSTQNVSQKVFLTIDSGNGTVKNFSTDFRQNITAFDLLKEAAENMSFAIKTKTYDIGIFIQAVNGTEGGTDGKYWIYYVNGQMANIGADKNYLKPQDKVEFKFEKPNF